VYETKESEVAAGDIVPVPGGIDVTSSEDGAGWLAFLRALVARGLSGVALVTSDDHAGLVNAVASVLPGAAWQRCRTHYHRNLLTRVHNTAQPWVSTLVRTIFEQPEAASVRAQYNQAVAALEAKLPQAAAYLDAARDDILDFTAFPREVWRQIWSNKPAGTAEQGDQAAHRRRRHLPLSRRHHPPRRRGAGRAGRRMDRITALHGTGNTRSLPEGRRRKRNGSYQ
jgi:transposase-like protein